MPAFVFPQLLLVGLFVPHVVCDRHLRSVGKDCLVSLEASVY